MLDSVESISASHKTLFSAAEWLFTLLFTAEYLARLWCAPKPWAYARSFYGVVDVLAILPTYLALFFPELHALIDVRVLRLIRVFRVFKLTHYMAEFSHLGGPALQRTQNSGVPVRRADGRHGDGHTDVRGGRPRQRLHEHPGGVYWAITTITTVGLETSPPKPTSAVHWPR